YSNGSSCKFDSTATRQWLSISSTKKAPQKGSHMSSEVIRWLHGRSKTGAGYARRFTIDLYEPYKAPTSGCSRRRAAVMPLFYDRPTHGDALPLARTELCLVRCLTL